MVITGLIFGALLLLAGLAIFWDTWDQTRWGNVQGVVVESALVRKVERATGEAGSRQHWTIAVRYTYAVDGQTYTGERYGSRPPRSPSDNDKSPSPELEILLAKYPPGGSVDVYFNPDNPREAFLHRFTSPSWTVLALGVAVLTVSLVAWLQGR